MRKSTFTEEQIAYALRQAEAGTPVPEVCRKRGVSEQTFYRWKRTFAGMGVAELRRLRQLEEENRRLKRRRWGSGVQRKTASSPGHLCSLRGTRDYAFYSWRPPRSCSLTR